MNLKYPFLVVAEGGIIGYTFVSCTRKALVILLLWCFTHFRLYFVLPQAKDGWTADAENLSLSLLLSSVYLIFGYPEKAKTQSSCRLAIAQSRA